MAIHFSLHKQSNLTYVGQRQQPPLHRRLFIQDAGLFISRGVVPSVLNITSAEMCFLRGVLPLTGRRRTSRWTGRQRRREGKATTGTTASLSSTASNIRCTSRCQISQLLPPAASARAQRDARSFVSPFHIGNERMHRMRFYSSSSFYVRSLSKISVLFPFLSALTSCSVLCESCISQELH